MANKLDPRTSHEDNPGSFSNEQEKLHWLLQINDELFSRELAKIVSNPTISLILSNHHEIPKYLVQPFW